MGRKGISLRNHANSSGHNNELVYGQPDLAIKQSVSTFEWHSIAYAANIPKNFARMDNAFSLDIMACKELHLPCYFPISCIFDILIIFRNSEFHFH